jgi:hypothetical protein
MRANEALPARAPAHRGGTCITDARQQTDETLRRSQFAPFNGGHEPGCEGGALSADLLSDALFAHDPKGNGVVGPVMEG